jgi:predicted ATPase
MAKREKSKSPFHPGQPVPPELFVGRREQIEKILRRGAAQVANGKPIAMYVQGEYGIGKSSIAGYAQRVAEKDHQLLRVYANLGGAQDIDGLAAHVLEATIRSGARSPTAGEKVRNWLGKYIGKQSLFGLTLNLEALRADAPSLATPGQMLGFLRETRQRIGENVRGIFLVLDELNGIVNEPQFAHFIKGLV